VDDLLQFEKALEVQKLRGQKPKDVVLRTRVGLDRGTIEPRQRFRSEEYQKAVYIRLRLEFAEHDYPTTIRAVLDENNYDYERTRTALTGIFKKKTLWSVFKGLFTRAKENAELKLREKIGCEELDVEIEAIAMRKQHQDSELQIRKDLKLATTLNEEEYTSANELMECGCCFGDYTWEDMIYCGDGHLVCRGCVKRTAEECAFGQADTVCTERGLKCIAVSNNPCDKVIPNESLEQFLPTDLFRRYTQRILSTELESAELDLIHCPFCPYAEFKDPVQPHIRLRSYLQHVVTLILTLFTFIAPLLLVNFTIPLIVCIYSKNFLQAKKINNWINDVHQRRLGFLNEGSRLFKCLNASECGRESCIDCGKEWAPFHDCLRSEKDGLRLYVEKAMADAIKRTVSPPSEFL